MNSTRTLLRGSAVLLIAAITLAEHTRAQSNVTTYQGRLENGGAPAYGSHDFIFRLCSSAGPGGVLQTFPPAETIAINVVDGLFTQELAFDAAHFRGADRFLEIVVDDITLAPRQRLAATPYATYALKPGHSLDAADGNPADAVFVDSTGFVGIGTTTPARPLEVRATQAIARLTTTNFINGSFLELNNDTVGPTLLGAINFVLAGQQRGQIAYHASDTMTFRSALVERMRLDPQGDFGIGVTDPTSRLHVNGDIRCDSGHIYVRSPTGQGVSDVLIDAAQDPGGGVWSLLAHANNTPLAGPPGGFSIYSGIHALAIDNANRVGINTVTPEARLHVLNGSAGVVTANGNSALVAEGAGSTYASILSPAAFERGILFGEPGDNAAGGVVYNNTNTRSGLQFRTGGNRIRMVISGDGNVGINTTAPSALLHATGSASDFRGVVLGEQTDGNVNGSGVFGRTTFTNGIGVIGEANTGSSAFGVWGMSTTGEAGHFSGNVDVAGTLSKNGGSFKIDHPLDPANKYLCHSFVESPDMMNVYNGNVTTDGKGYATVTLPEWFDILNRDFRYQLTVLDDADTDAFVMAKVVHKIAGNEFTIRTSAPNVEVSWQVTGIRKDAWANANRIPVEVDKPEHERGFYRSPELFGEPRSKMIEEATRPGSMTR